MLRITRGEESKLTSWYFETDRTLFGMVLFLIAIGILTMIPAGAAEAARIGRPWFHFIQQAFVPYSLGLISLFVFSTLNKKQIIKISVIGVSLGFAALLFTYIHPYRWNGSLRWVNIGGLRFMPSDIMKPFFIILTAWFLSFLHKSYGTDIFLNKSAWRVKWGSWWPYLLVFFIFVILVALHPDVGTALLYFCVFAVMLFVAGFPLKLLPLMGGLLGAMGFAAVLFMPHVRARAMHIFDIEPQTQAWYSVNAIKHGGLFGSGDEAFVKDVLPESINDYVYAAIAEDWGILGGCALIILLFLVLTSLIKHAMSARDDFVVYTIAGAAALFGGQICFNLMAALHLLVDKGMTLPFISYGGVSFITFCVLFGMVLSLIREDTWNK